MQPETIYSIAAFAAGLGLTLALAAHFTPRAWWRRPNARALLVLAGGTWGLGSLIAALMYAPPPALAVRAPPALAPATLIVGQAYRVYRDLNLRAGAGVNAARVAIVAGGTTVTPTGARDGDWWQIKAAVAGREQIGWASSLWLRRATEMPQ
ncbi:hypothetical protein AAKU55_005327 [Oxalobacteraceae bacterium GrIS 1.11]